MNKIICIVGMTGSGKSEVADELVKAKYHFIRFGQITLDKVKENGLEPTEENERKIRERIRKEYGMGAYATLNIPKFDALLEKGNVVADGLYSWTEYKLLKDYYEDNIIILAVLAPPQLRYERLTKRTQVDEQMRSRPASKEQAQSRDFAEIENIEKGGPIAMADYYILNTGTKEELKKKTQEFLQKIKE
ncbi:dephospho-CoA kinase [Candidatus Woesearchaeota archaeon CG_4_10_14_0_2_um_filter_33_13]|nr:MAG: dephospho-CoA kinase [Candidatus Woesearchaeota archaeon CG_4_10_14_0_2_um_filter_33_13]